jgi:hypothetical protein
MPAVVPGTMTMMGGAATTPSAPPAMTPTTLSRMAMSTGNHETQLPRPKRNAWILVVVVAAVVMGIAAFVAVRTMRDDNTASADRKPATAIVPPAAPVDAAAAVVPVAAPADAADATAAAAPADAAEVAPVTVDAATPMAAPPDAAPARQPKHLPRPFHRPKPGDDDIPDIR